MSINGLTEQYIPLSINGLSNINTNSIIINGIPFDPTLLVPYTGATTDVNLASNNLTANTITSNKIQRTTVGDLLIENSGGSNIALNATGASSGIYLESGSGGTNFTNPSATIGYASITPSGTSGVLNMFGTASQIIVAGTGTALSVANGTSNLPTITNTTINSTNTNTTNLSADIITQPSNSILNVGTIQYYSPSFMRFVYSGAPFVTGDIIRVWNNQYYNSVYTVGTVGPTLFFTNNPGLANNGTVSGGFMSLNKSFINTNVMIPKQIILDTNWGIFNNGFNQIQFDFLGLNKASIDSNGSLVSTTMQQTTLVNTGTMESPKLTLKNASYNWAMYSTSGGNYNIDLNTVNKIFIDGGGKLGATSLAFTSNLITNTTTLSSFEVSQLTGITSNIQAQLNALSGSGFITKTGTTTGCNPTLQLNATGSTFLINGYLGVLYPLFCVNFTTAGDTFIKNINSTSLINSKSASYYDISSSIQGLLDSKINLNGLTTIGTPVLQLQTSGDYFRINDEKSNEIVSFAKLFNTFTQESFFNCNAATLYSQLRIAYGSNQKTAMFHNNGSDFYILFSDTTTYPLYNALRPLFFNMTSGLLQSNNSQTFQGLTNLQNIQFSDITTVPNGLTTEVGQLINWQINFRNTSDRTIVTGTQGIFFRLDNRAGYTPFQYYFRAAGSSTETQLMGLDSNGDLTTGRRLICQTPVSGVTALLCKTFNAVGTNLGMTLGYDVSLNNTSMFSFNYTSSGSSSNFLGIGLFGSYERFKLYSNKAIFEDQVTVPSIKVGSGVISGKINPYVLSRTDAYNAMTYGETMSCVIYDQVAWTTGSTYISWFKKFTNDSTLSFVGNVTAYSSSANQNIYWRITFDNLTDGSQYVHEYSFYFNQAYIHTTIPCVGVVSSTGNSGFGTFATAGVYTVTFVRLNAYMQSDTGDTINIHFMITPNFRGL